MKRYLHIFSLYFQMVFQHRTKNFIWFLNAFINPLVLLLFWQGILAENSSLYGWNKESIRSYYLLLMIGQVTLMHHVENLVAYNDIKKGELMRELLRPFSYLKLRILSETPNRILQGFFGISTVLLFILLLQPTIQINTSYIILIQAAIIIIAAYFLSFLFKMILGLCAFWMTSIDSLLETNDVLMFALSGMILPINLFPSWMQNIANLTPFPYILYYPISSFIGIYNSAELTRVIISQLTWIGILSVTYNIMWKNGLKKFTGVGQ